MMRRGARVWVVLVLLGTGGFDLLWSTNRNVARGNQLLQQGKANEALGEYDRARKRLPDDPGVRYDRALALTELGKLDEAAQEFLRASEGHDAGLKAAALYNQGNVLMKQEKWQDAVQAYRRALAVDPRNFDAKWNLELALRKLKEQQQKQEQKKQEEEKKKQEEQKKKEEEQKKQQEQQQNQGQDGGAPQPKQEPKQDEKQQQPKQEEKQQPQPQPEQGKAEPQPQKPLDRESTDAVLDALEKNEKNLPLERLRMRSRRRPEKDW